MDIKHFYVEQGSDEPLILLHGNGESSDYFKNQLDVFSKHFRVIALDTRGHGKTPRGVSPFTIRQFADDLFDFMTLKGIDKADILGFSDGANIAMCFALKYPEKVNRLVLNGGNLDPSGVKRNIQAPIEIGYKLAKLFASRNEKANSHAEMLSLMVNDPNIKPAQLKSIDAKTLVIAGTHDMIKGEHTKLIAQHIKNSSLIFIEGDHFIAAKKPEEFNKAVLKFLLQ